MTILLLRLSLVLASLSAVTAFVTPYSPSASHRLAPLYSTSETTVPLVVSGRNVEVTDALMEHVNKRIGNVVNKLSGKNVVKECDVILSVSKNPKVSRQQGAASGAVDAMPNSHRIGSSKSIIWNNILYVSLLTLSQKQTHFYYSFSTTTRTASRS